MAILFFLAYVVFTLIILVRGMQVIIWEIGSAVYLVLATLLGGLAWLPALFLWLAIPATIALRRLPAVQEKLGSVARTR